MSKQTDDRAKEIADFHEQQGLFHAEQAMNNAPWYHGHERDTRRAAEHFTVAMWLRRKGERP